ncbi:MAG: CRTAC1 family protein, partial [bacterium]
MAGFVYFWTMGGGVHDTRSLTFEQATRSWNLDYRAADQSSPGPLAPSYVDNQGVFSADVNNDRRPDLFLTGGASPALLVNRDDTLKSAPIPDINFKVASAGFADLDRDGWKDLILVPQEGPLRLLKNDSGRYARVTVIDSPVLNSGSGLTLGDYDRDGCPDLFVLQYSSQAKNPDAPRRHKYYRLGKSLPSGSWDDSGRKNYLLLGDCSGGFRVVKSPELRRNHFSLAASSTDFTGNGWLDIHVANDFYRDSLYVNKGNGNFTHRYLPAATDRNGMSSAVSDINDDGRPEVFVSNIFVPPESPIFNLENFRFLVTSRPDGHNLLLNQGRGHFRDLAAEAGVQSGGWGWGSVFADFSNSSRRGIFQCRQNYLKPGIKMRVFDLSTPDLASLLEQHVSQDTSVPEPLRNHELFPELRDWLGFPVFYRRSGKPPEYTTQYLDDQRRDCRGVVAVDLNRDGYLEIVTSSFTGQYDVLETNKPNPGYNWIRLIVDDPRYYQGGYLTLELPSRTIRVPIGTGTGYKRQQPAEIHLGTGSVETLEELTVSWHSGSSHRRKDI